MVSASANSATPAMISGNTTASVMGRSYPGAGASIAASFVFAFIAAHHAAGQAREIERILAGDAGPGRSTRAGANP